MREDTRLRSSVAVGIVVLNLAFLFLHASSIRARDHASRQTCELHLRQIGLAAIQYCNDKRFFPHVAPRQELDGDATTSDAPRALRSLWYFNDLESLDAFCCPSSPDGPAERLNYSVRATDYHRNFGWNGGEENDRSPLAVPGDLDKPLAQIKDLSYGWTRCAFTSNTMSARFLSSDRAWCNHGSFLWAVCIDAHTRCVPRETPENMWENSERSMLIDSLVTVLYEDPHVPACSQRRPPVELEGVSNVLLTLAVVAIALAFCGLAAIRDLRRSREQSAEAL